MNVRELRSILEDCDPDAAVLFGWVDDDGEHEDPVNLVEESIVRRPGEATQPGRVVLR